MAKNLVVCCDGTGNEFGDNNSNVVKLYRMLERDPARQVAYYHPGVGTMGAPNALTSTTKWCTRMLGLAFGYRVMDNIADAYRFLMNNHEPGDRLFIFGFSRGAYTARALCAMLTMFGLFDKGNEALIAYAARLFKHPTEKSFEISRNFKRVFGRECKPDFVGVWDTVSSVGWIYDPLHLPFTANNPDIRIGRHAVAIDERRCFYRQNLWGEAASGQDLKQIWFAGVHSDIGGSYPEAQSGLSKITLEWMLTEAKAGGLRVNATMEKLVLGGSGGIFVPPDPTAYLHTSLKGIWWLLEFWPKLHWQKKDGRWRKGIVLGLGRRRHIPRDASIHPSVYGRMQKVPDYRPPNLPSKSSNAALE
jgi:uncharacterized protein (DUF2235 family)